MSRYPTSDCFSECNICQVSLAYFNYAQSRVERHTKTQGNSWAIVYQRCAWNLTKDPFCCFCARTNRTLSENLMRLIQCLANFFQTKSPPGEDFQILVSQRLGTAGLNKSARPDGVSVFNRLIGSLWNNALLFCITPSDGPLKFNLAWIESFLQ